MLVGIQFMAILFALVMVYMTFLYYKRGNYEVNAFLFWMFIWGSFLFFAMFPDLAYGVMEVLSIERTADFFVSGALGVLSVMLFRLYVRNKQLEEKIDIIVRKVALDKAYRKKSRKTK